MPSLRRDGDVFVLDLGDDENVFGPDWIGAVRDLLDNVVAESSPVALVTTGTGKFFSNGLDLNWLTANGERAGDYLADVQELLATMLELPVPTVAAVNGHAFGAGAMLAIAHDFRVMRADRGYLCFPEVDVRLPFTPGMAALVQGRTTPATAITAMTTGLRHDGPTALAAGLVDETAVQEEVLARAVGRAAALAGKDQVTLGAIKKTMYTGVLAALRTRIDG